MRTIVPLFLIVLGAFLAFGGMIVCFVIGLTNIIEFAMAETRVPSQLVWGICEVIFCELAALPGAFVAFLGAVING